MNETNMRRKIKMNSGKEIKVEPVLCYVAGPWAYFTTWGLSKQWGDDWDDAPYEYNAGPPYESKDGAWTIIKVAWDGPFETPADIGHSSDLSVDQINSGEAPWLKTLAWRQARLPNGDGNLLQSRSWQAQLYRSLYTIESAGGAVYLKES